MELTRQQIWTPLRLRGFRRLFMGQVLSDFANWLDFIALSTLIVYTWGYGSMAIAGLSICIGAPWVLVGPLMSVQAKRLSGRKVLIVCDWLRAGLVLCMIWAPSLAVVFLLVFLKMSVSAIFDPVRQSAVKRLVEPVQLAQASSLSQMSVNMTKVLGPMAGGAFIGWIGVWLPFLICAGLYTVSALILSGMPEWGESEQTSLEKRTGLHQSWNHIESRPLLKAGIVFAAMIFFLIFLYDGLFVLFTKEAGMNESQFGLLIGAVGAGSVIGALAAGQWSGWQQKPLSRMTMAGIVAGILIAFIGLGAVGWLPNTVWLWLPLCMMLGYCSAQSAVPLGFILQTESTDDTIGPISALSNGLQTGSMLIAPVMGAAAAAWISAGGVFISVGLVMTCLAMIYRYREKQKLFGI